MIGVNNILIVERVANVRFITFQLLQKTMRNKRRWRRRRMSGITWQSAIIGSVNQWHWVWRMSGMLHWPHTLRHEGITRQSSAVWLTVGNGGKTGRMNALDKLNSTPCFTMVTLMKLRIVERIHWSRVIVESCSSIWFCFILWEGAFSSIGDMWCIAFSSGSD